MPRLLKAKSAAKLGFEGESGLWQADAPRRDLCAARSRN